jgi:adenine-specific DNA-methyltransferase
MDAQADHAVATQEAIAEDPQFLTRQLLTYLGNKRSLLAPIANAAEEVKRRLGCDKLRVWDAFAGSGVVSRLLKQFASLLVSSDLEEYAAVVGRCFLRNRSEVDHRRLSRTIDAINRLVDSSPLPPGFIAELYSPRDESNIAGTDRVFYTNANARRLDDYRRRIDGCDSDLRDLLLGPLLSEASIHANTAGVFKGFYKDRRTKIGRFGGSNADALLRICGPIELAPPRLSRFESDVEVHQADANDLASRLKNLDLAYFDPPYNQHPYGSNYFMLNLLVRYDRPSEVSTVSGIPTDWRRSDYNIRAKSFESFRSLAENTDAKFLLVSFNDEGFIHPAEMQSALERLGRVEIVEIPHPTFRGSRNLRNRKLHVVERLFLVERG